MKANRHKRVVSLVRASKFLVKNGLPVYITANLLDWISDEAYEAGSSDGQSDPDIESLVYSEGGAIRMLDAIRVAGHDLRKLGY